MSNGPAYVAFIFAGYRSGMVEKDDAGRDELVPEVTMDPQTERRLGAVLVAALLLLLGCGMVVNLLAAPPPDATVSLANLSGASLVEIRDQRGTVVLSGEFRSRTDALGNTEMDADLGNRRGHAVIGEVEIEIPAAGREHRRPELEVDIIRLSPRSRYLVVIDDRTVGTFVTDDRGSVDMELQEGELADAPPPSPFPE
jgi:hypothetical protein